jgi:hypothetical protein
MKSKQINPLPLKKLSSVLVTLLMLVFIPESKAQFWDYNRAVLKQNAEKIKKTTLLVVTDEGDTATDNEIRRVFDTYWTFNPHKFIKFSEVNAYCKNPDYSICCFTSYAPHEGQRTSPGEPTFSGSRTEMSIEFGYGICLGDAKVNAKTTKKPVTTPASFDEQVPSFATAYVMVLEDRLSLMSGIELDTIRKERDGSEKEIAHVLNQSKPYTVLYIKRLQALLEDGLNGVIHKEHVEKVKPAGRKFNVRMSVFDNSRETLLGKTVLVYDKICTDYRFNSMGELVGIPQSQIRRASLKEIADAAEKNDVNTVLIYDVKGNSPQVFSVSGRLLLISYDDGMNNRPTAK